MQHKLTITIGLLAALCASSAFAFNAPCSGKPGASVGCTTDGKLVLQTASLSTAAVTDAAHAPAAAKDTLAPVQLAATPRVMDDDESIKDTSVKDTSIKVRPKTPATAQPKAVPTTPAAPVGAGTTATTATCSCPCDQKAATPASTATPTSLEQFGSPATAKKPTVTPSKVQ